MKKPKKPQRKKFRYTKSLEEVMWMRELTEWAKLYDLDFNNMWFENVRGCGYSSFLVHGIKQEEDASLELKMKRMRELKKSNKRLKE